MTKIKFNWQTIQTVLLTIAVSIMLLHTIIYIAFGIALIPFPFDYDQAEGYELNNAILLSQGDCPYCDNNVFPFYASGYAPFFHILMVPFVWVFGPALWYGRLIIFASTFITAAAIAYAVYRSERHHIVSILAGLAFLASNYIYHIGPLLRQHLLMVMFETLAVVFIADVFTRHAQDRHKRLILAFILLLLAGYTKQLAITTCAALTLWLCLRNPRTAILYCTGLALVAGAIFAGWMIITNGNWWINIISSNQNEYITEQFIGLFTQFVRLHWPLLLLSSMVVIYELYFSRLSAYSVWFGISLLSTIGAGKWGAGDSYFATTLAAACILSGIFVARTLKQQWLPSDNMYQFIIPNINRQLLGVVSLLLFTIYGITVVKFPTSGFIFGTVANTLHIEPKPGHRYPLYDAADWTVGYAVTGHFPSAQDVDNGNRILQRVKETDGYVMSEDASFSILAERPVITNGVQLRNLWENDLYNPDNLLRMIEDQEFGLIIRRADLFPPPILIAIDTHYRLDDTVPMNGFNYELWVPKDTAPTNS